MVSRVFRGTLSVRGGSLKLSTVFALSCLAFTFFFAFGHFSNFSRVIERGARVAANSSGKCSVGTVADAVQEAQGCQIIASKSTEPLSNASEVNTPPAAAASSPLPICLQS